MGVIPEYTRLMNLLERERNRSTHLTTSAGVCMYEKDLTLSQ